MKSEFLLLGLSTFALTAIASADFTIDRSAMSDQYWKIWNETEQKKIDADIERNRKADAEFTIDAPAGTEVTVEQTDHEFRFGAHIFNFNQLGKNEYNEAYKASYGRGGIFNQATVAFYWDCYEPVPGRLRAFGDYEDTARFWNSLTRSEAMEHPFWRRPAPAPVIDFLKSKSVAIHGHILIWGSAKPHWIYDWFCPENEKRAFDALGIPRRDAKVPTTGNWSGGYNLYWRKRWCKAYGLPGVTEASVAAMAPRFVNRMPEIFRKRVFDVARDFGEFVDSWDVVNESSHDWTRYRKSRTGLPVWFSNYGLMPGDYPLQALLDAREAFPAQANLAINDYNISEDFLTQVNELQDEGAKIDIVGCQMHIFNTNDCMVLSQGGSCHNWIDTPQMMEKRLDMMAKTGKPIHVSEITITSPGADARSRMIQAILTRNAYRKWFSHKAMMGITWWNTVDGGGVKGEPLVSGLFTTDMKKKPAYEALDQLINHEWKTRTKVKVTGDGGQGTIRFRGFKGRYRLTWVDDCGVMRFRDVRLTDSGIKDDSKGLASQTVKLSEAEMPKDHLRIVPKARVYGPVSKAVAHAKTVAAATAEAKNVGVDLALGENLTSVAGLFPGRFTIGSASADVAYLTFHVKSPRRQQTYFYAKCDWFAACFVNGTSLMTYEGETANWTACPIILKEGNNEIVFRCASGTGGWGAAFALRDPKSELAFED